MTGDDGDFRESSVPDTVEELTGTRKGLGKSTSKQGEEGISDGKRQSSFQ